MNRRELITLAGGAASAWPMAAWAQQTATQVKMPVIGYLSSGSPQRVSLKNNLLAFRQGLGEAGFVEGQNVAIEFRYAEDHSDRLPMLAAELASIGVAAITTTTVATALAAKATTTTIPIVFRFGADPVKLGLVASLNRPGGNMTGVTFLANLLPSKLFEFVHEAVPNATTIGFLVNATNPNLASETSDVQAAADMLGQKLLILQASTDIEIEAAFATAAQQKIAALVVSSDPFLSSTSEKIVALAARQALPTIYPFREYAIAGGLMSYGASPSDASYQAGVYVSRILKGDKPADLPVQQAMKVELLLNLKTAKTLGLTFPITLLGRADEVIE